jgi:P-type Ca2+ transporter type 2C
MSDSIEKNPGAWHTRTTDENIAELAASSSGLSAHEAGQRLEQSGPNILKEGARRSPLMMIVDQFKDLFIIILLIAAVIAGVVGDPVEAYAILAIVVLNAVIGFFQEFRAEKAIAALRGMAAPTATVLRDGAPAAVAAADIVPGDVVLLEAGNIVPADMRLLESAQLRAAESALTGESVPVEKHIRPLEDATLPLGDRANMVYSGTAITYGRGSGLVVATGMQTELGRIAHMLEEEKVSRTPLQHRLDLFSKKLALVILAVVAVIFATGLVQGQPLVLMFLTAVSLAVAAIPEALPAVITISLAFGAKKMVKQNALIRHLPAVETLGSVTCICSDKTGTLTMNKMTVEAVHDGTALFEGPRLPGFAAGGPQQETLLRAMALSNDAYVDAGGVIYGDPTETALWQFAREKGFDKAALEKAFPRIAELPFDSERKMMTTLHRCADGSIVAFTKGALESVLAHCPQPLEGSPADNSALYAAADGLAGQGLRVLGFAMRRWEHEPAELLTSHVETQLRFIGLAGLIDPPRDEAREAVELCRSAGIRPIMITGDHPVTARAIAGRLSIINGDDEVLTGRELEQLSLEAFERKVDHIGVYARVAPEQKLKIVRALQDRQQFAAMTGDGVNDAPALKSANIGIAMGITGTDVAKEASDMILLDDNFATIVKSVREGRRIYDNIIKFIMYSLTSNAATIWLIFLAPFLGLPLPLVPIQILWMNLLCDSFPGLALTAEPADPRVMQRPPRPYGEGVFASGRALFMMVVGLLSGLASLAFLFFAVRHDLPWQTMLFTSLVLGRMAVALGVRSGSESFFRTGVSGNMALLGAIILTCALQFLIVYVPVMQPVFKTQQLSVQELGITILLSFVPLLIIEAVKLTRRLAGRPTN